MFLYSAQYNALDTENIVQIFIRNGIDFSRHLPDRNAKIKRVKRLQQFYDLITKMDGPEIIFFRS